MGKFLALHYLCSVSRCSKCRAAFLCECAKNEFSGYARYTLPQLRGKAPGWNHFRYCQNYLLSPITGFQKVHFICLRCCAYGCFAASCRDPFKYGLTLPRLSRWVRASSHLHSCTLQDNFHRPRVTLHGNGCLELRTKYCCLRANCLSYRECERYTAFVGRHWLT